MARIESVMRELPVFPSPAEFVAQANIKKTDFDRLNAAAAADYKSCDIGAAEAAL